MRMLTADVPLTVAAGTATDPRLVHDRTRLHSAESAVLALLVAPLLACGIWPVPCSAEAGLSASTEITGSCHQENSFLGGELAKQMVQPVAVGAETARELAADLLGDARALGRQLPAPGGQSQVLPAAVSRVAGTLDGAEVFRVVSERHHQARRDTHLPGQFLLAESGLGTERDKQPGVLGLEAQRRYAMRESFRNPAAENPQAERKPTGATGSRLAGSGPPRLSHGPGVPQCGRRGIAWQLGPGGLLACRGDDAEAGE